MPIKRFHPAISVLLCTYNAEQYIYKAIESTLQQSFHDFELLIIDDGSTDNTLEIIKSFHDSRVRVIRGKHNYIKSLNIGMRNCNGKYIARMDADDLMMPERLKRQYSVLQKYPDISVCFSWARKFGLIEGLHGFEIEGKIKNALFWLIVGNYLIHPTAMFRKDFLKEHHIYYKNYPYAEDYKLWVDIAKLGDCFYVIPEPLLQYRTSKTQVSFINREKQMSSKMLIQQEILETLLKRINHPQKRVFIILYQQMLKLNSAEIVDGEEIIVLLYKLLRRTKYFDEDIRMFNNIY